MHIILSYKKVVERLERNQIQNEEWHFCKRDIPVRKYLDEPLKRYYYIKFEIISDQVGFQHASDLY